MKEGLAEGGGAWVKRTFGGTVVNGLLINKHQTMMQLLFFNQMCYYLPYSEFISVFFNRKLNSVGADISTQLGIILAGVLNIDWLFKKYILFFS